MRKRDRELILASIAKRIRTELGAPKALNAPLVAILEELKARAPLGPEEPEREREPAEHSLHKGV
jgi:hypothetical protein